ncbi:hypothetical protein R0J87_22435, partial [Halomonas sp. SIMBA_159]
VIIFSRFLLILSDFAKACQNLQRIHSSDLCPAAGYPRQRERHRLRENEYESCPESDVAHT